MRRRISCALTAALCLASIAGCDRGTEAEDFFGARVWRVMEGAERMEAFRVVSVEKPVNGNNVLKGGVRIVGAPADPGEEWLKIFALIEDPKTYGWGKALKCKPRPEVLFRFIRGAESVDFLVCFDCSAASLDWSESAMEDKWVEIGYSRDGFIELAQRIFVLDQFIQSLKTSAVTPKP